MSRRVTAISWVQRVVLATAVVAIVGFGVRATGTAVAKLNVATGSLWLASPANGSVVQANPSSLEPTASIVVSPRPGELLEVVQQGPSAVVLNRSSGEIGRIDGVSLKWDLGRTFSSASADLHLAGNAESGSLYLHDAAQGLIGRLDPTLLSLLSEEKVQPGRSFLEVDKDSNLWTFDPRSGDVVTIRKDGSSRRQHLVGSESGAALTLVNGQPYLADPDRGRVMALSTKTAKAGDQRCFDPDTVSDSLITGSDSTSQNRQVFVVSPSDGVLHTSDLERNQCVRLQISSTEDTVSATEVANEYGQPVAHNDVVFIPLLSKGKVMVIDALLNRVERLVTVTPPGKQFELVLNNGVVWFNNLAGADAGTLDREGIITTIRKYESRSAGVTGGQGSETGLTFSNNGDDPVDTRPGGSYGDAPRDKSSSPPTTAATTRSPNNTGVPGRRSLLEDLANKTESPSEGAANSAASKSDPTNPSGAALEKSVETPPPSPNVNLTPSVGVTVNSGDAADRTKTAPANPTATTEPGATQRAPTATTAPPPALPSSTLVARIATSAAIVEVGQTLSLVDRSLGGPTEWLWNFGDDQTDARQNPTHVYTKAGRFLVTLQISAGSPTQARTTVTIEVREKAAEEKPVAQFTLDASVIEVATPVQFTDRSVGKITAWEWDFGDNTKSNAATKVSHAWSAPGTYTVSLTVRNEFGATVTQRSVVVVALVAPPKASFEWSPNRPAAGQTILFRSTSSGNPTDTHWDFGNEQSAVGETVTRRFDAPGTYEVLLRVTNGKGSDRLAQTVTVAPASGPPTASFNLGSQSTESNVPLQFTSTSSGIVSRVLWDFGDSTTSTNATAQHAWSRPGRYSVTLTAFNNAGSSQAGPVVVTVTAPNPRPVKAAFINRPGARPDDAVEPGSAVFFVDRSTGATSWNWDFGDGTSDIRQNPSHVYARSGTYTVRLRVTDGQSTDQDVGEVYVRGAPTVLNPVADFTIAPAKPLAGQAVSFTDRSANTPTQWRWDFGDNRANSAQQNPTHTFANPGSYSVILTALNSAGASNKSIVVEVAAVPKQPPTADFVIVTPPSERFVGRPITFRALASGAVSTPVFIFAQNEQVTADSTNTVSRTFTTAGIQNIGMRVCWADDRTNCTTRTHALIVTANVALPQVSFSIRGPGVIDQQTANAGTAITFSDTSTGEALQSWKWVIGNQTREGREVVVTIDAPGDVAVSLTVTNSAGSQQGSRVLKILPLTPVTAAFVASNAGAAVAIGTPVAFTDRSTGNPTSWRWDFGDRTAPATGTTASHTFAAPGRYTVILTASSATGRDTAQVDIDVVAPAGPKPRIQAIGATLTPGENNGPFTATVGSDIRFFDAAAGTAGNSTVLWRWEFSDGGTASTASTRHVFTKTGLVTVTVLATDRLGQSGTDTFQILIVAAAQGAPTPAAPAPAAPQVNPPV